MSRSHICFGITSNSPEYKKWEQNERRTGQTALSKRKTVMQPLSPELEKLFNVVLKRYNTEMRKRYALLNLPVDIETR